MNDSLLGVALDVASLIRLHISSSPVHVQHVGSGNVIKFQQKGSLISRWRAIHLERGMTRPTRPRVSSDGTLNAYFLLRRGITSQLGQLKVPELLTERFLCQLISFAFVYHVASRKIFYARKKFFMDKFFGRRNSNPRPYC